MTPLMYGAGKSNTENIRLLIAAGADAGAVNRKGMSALEIAVAKKRDRVEKVLRELAAA
jgi:ankyrin repeat protein